MSEQTEGRKDDAGKTRWDLVPVEELDEVARVFTLGAGKYGDRNFEQGMAYGRCFRAACDHLFKWWRGQEKDPETGCSHLSHAVCSILMLHFISTRYPEHDDRSRLRFPLQNKD